MTVGEKKSKNGIVMLPWCKIIKANSPIVAFVLNECYTYVVDWCQNYYPWQRVSEGRENWQKGWSTAAWRG